MKSIILFRHGKSDWDSNYGKDHDRPLAPRGIKDAKKMGLYLSSIKQTPDLTISSTAERAKNTAKLALKSGKWDSSLILERSIYESTIDNLLFILSIQKQLINKICLVGHEPTFSSFISIGTNSDWRKFPTCAMARIDFNTERWNNIKFGEGKLCWVKKPKEID